MTSPSIFWRMSEPGPVLVLCADADVSVRIVHWLAQASYTPVQVFDGYHAASVLRQHRVSAVITDRLLPPWPGLDAFSVLRRVHPALAVVFIGNAVGDSVDLAGAAGATHVLTGPMRRQSVLDALAKRVAAA